MAIRRTFRHCHENSRSSSSRFPCTASSSCGCMHAGYAHLPFVQREYMARLTWRMCASSQSALQPPPRGRAGGLACHSLNAKASGCLPKNQRVGRTQRRNTLPHWSRSRPTGDVLRSGRGCLPRRRRVEQAPSEIEARDRCDDLEQAVLLAAADRQVPVQENNGYTAGKDGRASARRTVAGRGPGAGECKGGGRELGCRTSEGRACRE